MAQKRPGAGSQAPVTVRFSESEDADDSWCFFPREAIFSTRVSKPTMNARIPELFVGRSHRRWFGSRPGRVEVNTQGRFSHGPFGTNWFHAPAGRRGPGRGPRHPRTLPPFARPRAITGLARLGPSALAPPGRSRTVPEGSGQCPPPVAPRPRRAADARWAASRPSKTGKAHQPRRGASLTQTCASIPR